MSDQAPATEETAASYTKTDAKKDYKRWKVANVAYHNGVAIMSDTEFDRLTKKLKPFYPDIDKKVGAEPMAQHASARKVRLEIPMNSLDKAYGKDLPRVIKSKIGTASEAVIAEKVDGASLQITRNDKGEKKLYTRGKDGVGQDVSHLIPHLEAAGIIGNIAKGEAIRFELVIPKGASKDYDSDDLKKRNAIAGIINARTPDLKTLRKATAIALSYMRPALAPERAYKKLKQAGWNVPKWKKVKPVELTDKLLTSLYTSWRERARYDMDGLVVSANVAEEPKLTNPKRAFAFKINEAGPTAEIVRIVWQVSRYKQMKPVAEIKPVMLNGVKVTRATLHNAKYVKDNKLGPGAQIEIIRSGGVIPYVVQVIRQAAKPSLPKAGTYEWDETKVNISSVDESHDEDANARQLQTFFSKIGVIGFGPSVAKLVGTKSIHEVVSMTSLKWTQTGGGPAISRDMPNKIKAALEQTTVPKLMAYSAVFGQGFGESSANDLWQTMQDSKPSTRQQLASELAALPGWSAKSAREVASQWKAWVRWFNALPYKPSKKAKKAATKTGPLVGRVFVFTQVRDRKLEQDIESAGGTIANSVTKATTDVIYADGQASVKRTKAEESGIRTIPFSKARSRLKL